MTGKFNSVHAYVIFAIFLTILIDLTGLLTSSNYKIHSVSYSSDFTSVQSEVDFNKGAVELHHDKNESLNISITPNGFGLSTLLSVDFTGAIPFLKKQRTQAKINCLDGQLIRPCRLKVNIDSDNPTHFLLYTTEDSTTIHNIELNTYRAKRSTAVSGTIIFAYFFFLALFGILFTKLTKQTVYILLTLLSSMVLAFLSIKVFISILMFLGICYLLINYINNTDSGKGRNFSLLLGIVLLSLIIIKVLIPYSSQYFLNPGSILLAIPLGFSYFIIKIIDLGIDAFKGNLPKLSVLSYITFMLFPSTLPAGPIKTFRQFTESRIKDYSVIDYSAGMSRVIVGIIKKLISDTQLSPTINTQIDQFVINPENAPDTLVFEFLIRNFLYIYLDFSAYCDMAIGSSRAMGFKVPENFKWPIFRTSLAEYWQNWHITLSSWVRKNIFMNTMLKTRSLMLATFSTMMVIGLWHKLSLGWLTWAVHHSFILRGEDYIRRSFIVKSPIPINFPTIEWVLIKVRSVFMMFYVWFVVAAGQSFIIFSDYNLSLAAYFDMLLTIPVYLLTFF